MTLDTLHIILLLIALAASAAAFVFWQRKPPDTAHLTAELGERAREVAALKSEVAGLRQRAEAAEKAHAADAAKMAERDASMVRGPTCVLTPSSAGLPMLARSSTAGT